MFFSQFGFSQTQSEIDSLLNRICEEVNNSEDIIINENSKKIIQFGKYAYEGLNKNIESNEITKIYSDCKNEILTKGEVTTIISNHIVLEERTKSKKGRKFLKVASRKQIIELLKNNYWLDSESGEIIKYWFDGEKGNETDYEKDDNGELVVIDNHPVFEITKKRKKFVLNFTSLYEQWMTKIVFISYDRLILKKEGEYFEYRNIKIE